VSPTRTAAVAGVMPTLATPAGAGGCTVSVVLADLPSAEAVMVAVPAATPVTTPLASTRAIVSADELQVTVRPLSALPAASLAAAASVIERPMATVPPAPVVIATSATGVVFTGGGLVPGPGPTMGESEPPHAVSMTTAVAREGRSRRRSMARSS
jgi:hypothetical protein